MAPPGGSVKARVYGWLVNPCVARRCARANDVFHYAVIYYMLFASVYVGPLWHFLFVAFVVRCQYVYQGCPLTKLSVFMREIEGEDASTAFRQGVTATFYQKFGKKAQPLILIGWLIFIAIENYLLHLVRQWI